MKGKGDQTRSTTASSSVWPAAAAVLLVAMGLALSSCNTAQGVGEDVSATGHAVTRGAQDVKSGL